MRFEFVAWSLVALLVSGCSSGNDTSRNEGPAAGGNSGATASTGKAGSDTGPGGSTNPPDGRAGLGGGSTNPPDGRAGLAGANASGGSEQGGYDTGGASSPGGRRGEEAGSSGNGGAPSTGGNDDSATAGADSSAGGTDPAGDIGRWTDSPGACPTGMAQIEITSVSDLEEASRGEGSHEGEPDSVCYFIHDGTYAQSGSTLLMYIAKGGTDARHRRVFVGQSRTGVIVRGRAYIESGASHVQITNLTFDLTGYSQEGSFNTLDLSANSSDLRIDHVTFTGDCRTGANGGHVEVNGASDVLVEACLIERFGRCGPDGHQDHGIYLSSGTDITIRSNEIRGNASRGIQLYTQGGEYGALDGITIELNRIHTNGHADYEDGIAMNAADSGTISDVLVERNLIYGNYYSGLRSVGDAFDAVVIRNNTFYRNGVGSAAEGRSEINLDDEGSGAETTVTGNIIVAQNRVLNDCYDAEPRNYLVADNFVQGAVPSGESGNCISGSVEGDPGFVDVDTADFHTQNEAASDYGAYAR